MRFSKTLKKIRAGKSARMCVLGHYVPAYVKMAARSGFDCIWLDLEHRLIDDREVQALLAYSHLADIDILVRTPTTDKTKLYRYLEDGAAGLMVPHVSTPEKARAMVEAAKFPPIGDRGMDGVGLDADFNLEQNQDDYGRHANSETFLVVQIETPQAVEHVEEIAAMEGGRCSLLRPRRFRVSGSQHRDRSDPRLRLGASISRREEEREIRRTPRAHSRNAQNLHRPGRSIPRPRKRVRRAQEDAGGQ